MPNPGSFLGSRFEFLRAQNRLYATAVVANTKEECIADIQRHYFKQYPIDLEHNVEPTQEFLDSVDDDKADPEIVVPDPSLISPEEFEEATLAFEERHKLVVFRKQVSRFELVISMPFLVTRLSRVLPHFRTSLSRTQRVADISFRSTSKLSAGSRVNMARLAARRSEKLIRKTPSPSLWLDSPVQSWQNLARHLCTTFGPESQPSKPSSTRNTNVLIPRAA